MKFPNDLEKKHVIMIFERLGFKIVRIGNHISMLYEDQTGKKIPLTLPNHKKIKSSTLRSAVTQAGISREEFLEILKEI